MTDHHVLYNKIQESGISYEHVTEVGVWHPDTSSVLGFILDGIRTTLVEPEPKSIELIKKKFIHYQNVEIKQYAVCDFTGEVELFNCESSTFVGKLESSPAIINDLYHKDSSDSFVAQAITFDQLDDGSIDILSIDTEGSEWFVLQNLVSRPKVISLETHGGAYINPSINSIKKWMQENDYELWWIGSCDSIYVTKKEVEVTLLDKIKILFMKSFLLLETSRKRLRNKFK